MKFYTKFQLPQNLFSNVRNIPKFKENCYIYEKHVTTYDATWMSITVISHLLRDPKISGIPKELKYLKKKSKTYLYISLLVHCVILLPLTFLVALTQDLIDIVTRPITIALNLALDIAQVLMQALILSLQFVAFCIEKIIINPIAFVIKKLFGNSNEKEGAGAGQEEPEHDAGYNSEELQLPPPSHFRSRPKAQAAPQEEQQEPESEEDSNKYSFGSKPVWR